jgi:hypothetical protein
MEETAFKNSLRASKESTRAALESLILDGPLMVQRLIKTHILTPITKRESPSFTMESLKTINY